MVIHIYKCVICGEERKLRYYAFPGIILECRQCNKTTFFAWDRSEKSTQPWRAVANLKRRRRNKLSGETLQVLSVIPFVVLPIVAYDLVVEYVELFAVAFFIWVGVFVGWGVFTDDPNRPI